MKIQWKKVTSPGFVVALVILLVSLSGMTAAMELLGLYLIKKPIPLRRELDLLSDRFGHYVVVEKVNGFRGGARRLDPEQEDALGTTQYITWVFRDERKKEGEPGALIRLHIPYYTGTIDSVPHVPDRCFIAGGAVSLGTQTEHVTLQSDRIHEVGGRYEALTALNSPVTLPDIDIPMTIARFAPPDNQAKVYCVAYFFVANNTYVATPEGVRLKALNVTDKYAYHCKIEVQPFGVGDVEEMKKLVGDFLSSAMPEIMLCLPDWQAVQSGKINPQPVAVGN